MTHPFDGLIPARRARVFLLLLAATLVVAVALRALDGPLRTAASPKGIFSYEIAGDVSTAEAIVASWDTRARTSAGMSLGLDYLFLCLYSSTIAFACTWAGRVLRARGLALARLGTLLAWGQWVAAGCDGVENLALAVMLLTSVYAPWPHVAWWAATVKFALITMGGLYALGAAGVWLVSACTDRR